jgi:single-strand DNA-binding protein
MNSCHLIGRLTQDVELRQTKGGTDVAVMRIAVNDNRDKPLFLTVEVYGRAAPPAGKYLAKGREVAVSGRLEIDAWETDGVKRERPKIVGRVEFLGSRSRTGDDAFADEALAAAGELGRTAGDDIPF